MRKATPMMRLSLGLTSLLVSLLFAAHALGLFPDREGAELKGRKRLCESLAVACSLAAERDDAAMVRQLVRSVVDRTPEILSSAVRRADGSMLVTVGDHARGWDAGLGQESTPTHMRVPIVLGNKPWGTLEIRYRPLFHFEILGLVGGSLAPLVGFIAVAGFAIFFLYLRSVLRASGHGKAGVVPQRVRDTLNTVMEGVLLLDKEERIALANDAFAQTVGIPAESLRGRRASELCGPHAELPPRSEILPWAKAINDGVPQRGTILRLRSGAEFAQCVRQFDIHPRRRRCVPRGVGHVRRPDFG